MRLSRNQRDALFILIRSEMNGNKAPMPFVVIRDIINSQRNLEVSPQNLRVGMRTSARHGLLKVYRHPTSLTLAFQLTDEGRAVAESIYSDRTRGE